jgi:hypothetical protein
MNIRSLNDVTVFGVKYFATSVLQSVWGRFNKYLKNYVVIYWRLLSPDLGNFRPAGHMWPSKYLNVARGHFLGWSNQISNILKFVLLRNWSDKSPFSLKRQIKEILMTLIQWGPRGKRGAHICLRSWLWDYKIQYVGIRLCCHNDAKKYAFDEQNEEIMRQSCHVVVK